MPERSSLADFPNLNKYQSQNIWLQNQPLDPTRVVFIGDSITAFWSAVMPEYFQNSRYINRGISGQTTPQIYLRFTADVLALKPAVVVILAGTNDLAGNTGPATIKTISETIFDMVELAQNHGIKAIMCSVLPAIDFPWSPNQNPAARIIALNALLLNYATTHGIAFVDYHSAMADTQNGLPKIYSYDGVHPNKKGYQIMAPIVDQALAGC
ncbi:GDSL-type esterase/lipase family protein [Flavobacterium crassostreae]|uniref:Acylhydrolase n=1 Tax=Flavobacterium crassostreae TaxID=1763534 RepID=A0A1B9E0M0_9FLAO|nr:GDSL-type esterase/lipase family protein [Flavobacterium crassostreae]OCB75489.1 acylhydrolase [Flavobacterium crassostreae]